MDDEKNTILLSDPLTEQAAEVCGEEIPAVSTGTETLPDTAETDRTESEIPDPVPFPHDRGHSPVRTVIRAVPVLSGLFAAVFFAVCIMESAGGFLAAGPFRTALGELYGGTDNVTLMSRPDAETEQEELENPSETSGSSESMAETDSHPAPDQTPQESTADEPEETEPAVPRGSIGILTADIAAEAPNGLVLINETPYTPELLPVSERAVPPLESLYARYGSDAPVVLVLHTHGTESYAEEGASHTGEEAFRSENPAENMLAVGETFADTLTDRGINTIFCTELFDAEDFNMSYYNASLKIREYLAAFPSISYIFDLHRDSIPQADGKQTLRPVTSVGGEDFAQAMIVVGTDHGGSGHTGWTDNFNLACRIQSRVHARYGRLMRPVNLRSASFNEQYTKGSLLIEVGAVGCSLEEACRTAEILGECIADEIIG